MATTKTRKSPAYKLISPFLPVNAPGLAEEYALIPEKLELASSTITAATAQTVTFAVKDTTTPTSDTVACNICGVTVPISIKKTLWCCKAKGVCPSCCGTPEASNTYHKWVVSGYAKTTEATYKECCFCHTKVLKSDFVCSKCSHYASCCVCLAEPLYCASCDKHVAQLVTCCETCEDCPHVGEEECDELGEIIRCFCPAHATNPNAPNPDGKYWCPCGKRYNTSHAAQACCKFAWQNIKGHDSYDPSLAPIPLAEHARIMRERALPWIQRGEKVTPRKVNINHAYWKQIDPISAMAEFYLLFYMRDDSCGKPDVYGGDREDRGYYSTFTYIAEEVRREREAFVAFVAPILARYVDIAVGGELRHHRVVRNAGCMMPQRNRAWEDWLGIRYQTSSLILLDAANLFADGSMGTGYGGEKWAAAARLLYQYETGKFINSSNPFPMWLFVDRVWTMQHNGGSLLNKVAWKNGYPGQLTNSDLSLCQRIGDAHASNPPNLSVLYAFASGKTQSLFNRWWKARNGVRRAQGLAVQPLPVTPPEIRWGKEEGLGAHWYFPPAARGKSGVKGFWFPLRVAQHHLSYEELGLKDPWVNGITSKECEKRLAVIEKAKVGPLYIKYPYAHQSYYLTPDGKWRGRPAPPILNDGRENAGLIPTLTNA